MLRDVQQPTERRVFVCRVRKLDFKKEEEEEKERERCKEEEKKKKGRIGKCTWKWGPQIWESKTCHSIHSNV